MIYSVKTIIRRAFSTAIVLSGCTLPAISSGQTGVSPSQTGLFFDDLRQRANQFNQSSQTRNAGTYDFNEDRGYEDQRSLGQRRVFDEEGRAIGTSSEAELNRYQSPQGGDSGTYRATSSYFAPTYITDPFLGGKRNIKAGPINIGLGLSTNVEYNDNITRRSSDKLEDIIAGVMLNTDFNWQITEDNRLTMTFGVGVDHYFNHPEASPTGNDLVLNVLPGSTIAFDMKIGDVMVVFYDRMSVRPVARNDFGLDNNDIFGEFQNDFGVGMNWTVNSRTNLSLNLNRSDLKALEGENEMYDRVIHSLSASLAFSPSGTYTVGLEGSLSVIDYDQEFNNDGVTGSAGVFVMAPLSKNTTMRAAVGYQVFDFDSPARQENNVSEADIIQTERQIRNVDLAVAQAYTMANPVDREKRLEELNNIRENLNQFLGYQRLVRQRDLEFNNSRSFDNEDLSDFYYNVALVNRINARLSHQLNFGRESSLNTNSNFITSDYVNYGVTHLFGKGTQLSVSSFWERGEDSGGRFAETTKQWGLDVFLGHRITKASMVGLGYHYADIDSDVMGRDYQQHSFTLDVNYALNEKLNMGLGYRYWTTEAEDPDWSFDQNRIIMTMNYNF